MSTSESSNSHRSSQGKNSSCVAPCARKFLARWFVLFAALGFICAADSVNAVLVDQWLAESLVTLSRGDLVGSWSSASHHTVTGTDGLQPVLKKKITPPASRSDEVPSPHFNASVLLGWGRTRRQFPDSKRDKPDMCLSQLFPCSARI